jgi:predicted nuclease of predicted toxin-antitoxin system
LASRLLFDENMSRRVAEYLFDLGFQVYAVGMSGAPPLRSSDQEVVVWCVENDAVLVTLDRGRRDSAILLALASVGAHVLFVWMGITPRLQAELVVRHVDKILRDANRAEVTTRPYRRRLRHPWRFERA